MRTRHVLKALLPAAPRLIAVLLVLLIVSVIGMGTVGAIGRPELNRALLATVRLAVPVEAEEDTYSTGSGTILTENGYILTNFHVMGDVDKEELYNEDGIAFVAVNPTNLRGEPVWKYRAHLVKGDTTLDLAVIKIDGLLDDEKEPLPEKLGLTTVPIGDSEAVMIGDEINIIGFPSIARGSVTFTDGKVAGFLDDDKDGVIDWFKTDAEIARGNSGGLAANADGEIIGVPTIVVADTETASNIGLVRPIDRALALFRAALSQEDTTERQRGLPSLRKGKATGPQVENVRFATAVDRKGLPIEPASRFDLTTKTVYAVFDYVNFKDGADFEYTWYQDGFEILSDSLQWEDGPQGSFWLNIHSKKPFPEGFYELEILLDGERLYRGGFVVGEAQPETTPENGSFGPITFATGVTENNEPVNPGETFSEVQEIYAFFDVIDVPNGVLWTRRWYLDDELALEKEQVWNGGSAESWWISIVSDELLPVGRYRLELLIEDELVQEGEFEIVEPEKTEKKAVEGVQVVGTVVEADNRRNVIPGVRVFFLQPGISVSQFLDELDEDMVYAFGISDRRGNYQLDRLVTPGEQYGIVAYHERYQLVTADDYLIDPEATSPWEINILMQR